MPKGGKRGKRIICGSRGQLCALTFNESNSRIFNCYEIPYPYQIYINNTIIRFIDSLATLKLQNDAVHCTICEYYYKFFGIQLNCLENSSAICYQQFLQVTISIYAKLRILNMDKGLGYELIHVSSAIVQFPYYPATLCNIIIIINK